MFYSNHLIYLPYDAEKITEETGYDATGVWSVVQL